MELTDKLDILADAAKYDASCASSGAPKRSSEGKEGIGATSGMGIYLDLARLKCSMKKIAPFIVTAGYRPVSDSTASHLLRRAMAEHPPQQLDLWAQLQAA